MSKLCSICDSKLEGGKQKVTVKKVGLQSLIRASKERGEERHLNWVDLDELVVHKQCQLGFICKRQIAAAKKRKLKAQDSGNSEAGSSSDLKSKSCLICGVTDDGEKEFEEKVKKSELKKLISISKDLGDDKHLNWVDVEIVAHKECLADYLDKKAPAKKRKLA